MYWLKLDTKEDVSDFKFGFSVEDKNVSLKILYIHVSCIH